MKLHLFRWIALVAALFGTIAMAAPASAATYRFPPGTLSPQFRDGGCVYRIWYGNFGNTPFAKVRMYTNACSMPLVRVGGQRGSTVTWYANYSESTNRDSCGAYRERQATGTGTPAIGVALRAQFWGTGNNYYFWHDHGNPVRPYRYC